MYHTSAFRMPLCVAATLASAFVASAQDAPKTFTARELFYSAGEDSSAKPAVKAAAKPAQNTAQTPDKRPSATATVDHTPKPVSTPHENPPKSNTVVATRVQPASSTTPDGSSIIKVSDVRPDRAPAPTNGRALGVRITVLKRSGNEDVEVAPDTVFHAGDRIQFSVQTNSPGYLYIVNQGSSGTWKPIFPSTEVDDGDNHVDAWRSYLMPPKTRMLFDEQTGTEKVFIVFSRQPEAEFENMIYDLPGKGQTPTQVTPSKSVPEAKPQKSLLVTAQLNLPDSKIDKLRQAYSRDLIIEKVDDSTPSTSAGEKKEKAIYYLNAKDSTDPRVVVDLSLVHQ